MSSGNDQLDALMSLSEPERARIALALLDSLSGPDPYEATSPQSFRAEMNRRADEAYEGPDDSMDWDTARERILGSTLK